MRIHPETSTIVLFSLLSRVVFAELNLKKEFQGRAELDGPSLIKIHTDAFSVLSSNAVLRFLLLARSDSQGSLGQQSGQPARGCLRRSFVCEFLVRKTFDPMFSVPSDICARPTYPAGIYQFFVSFQVSSKYQMPTRGRQVAVSTCDGSLFLICVGVCLPQQLYTKRLVTKLKISGLSFRS